MITPSSRAMPPLICSLALLAAWPAQAQQGDRPPPAVTVVTLQPGIVETTTTLPGRVVASAIADVRPQVAGIITEQLFQEGGRVEAGDVLYTIDPATYQAAVAQADAAVAQSQAELNAVSKEATRVQELATRNVASDQAVENARAAGEGAAAGLQAALARLQAAQIELDRTQIRARLSGEIGRSLASRGALVTASQAEPLAVIRNIDPVFVDVTQSAADLLAWRQGNSAMQLDDTPREVTLTLADGSTFDQTGTLRAAEPNVDAQTGVVVLRMQFANPDKLLLPGMYVQVEMPTGKIEGAFRVPQEAVSRDRRGLPTALVVGADDVVEARDLTVRQELGTDWIVTDGIAAGDRVIVAGLQNSAPGTKVTAKERAPADTGAAAAPDPPAPTTK